MPEEKFLMPNYGHAVHEMLKMGFSYNQISHQLKISTEDAKAFEEMEVRYLKEKEKNKK